MVSAHMDSLSHGCLLRLETKTARDNRKTVHGALSTHREAYRSFTFTTRLGIWKLFPVKSRPDESSEGSGEASLGLEGRCVD